MYPGIMCGIFGVIQRDPRKRPDPDRVVAARQTLVHRGPDEAGLWLREGVALAHRRLKILDLSLGQQPIVHEDRLAMIYNGEVYNFQELRRTFEAQGATFISDCDTEVIFHGLNHLGPEAVKSFNGMFALGHWDETGRRLLLVRDRMGQKPLYWYADEEQFVFASEMKAILEYLQRKFAVSAAALDEFFTRGYIASPRTIFHGINKLPAGHWLHLNANDWSWRLERYWDVEPIEIDTDRDDDVIDELDALLSDSVRLRMVSDVPLGCLLSGGIDSSLITAIAARSQTEPINAFSIGYENEAFNELPFAKIVAEQEGCRWETRILTSGDFLAELDEACWFFDEPFGNFTVTSQRTLSRLCRESLTVVLSGQGGDELTAGYPGRYNWVLDTQTAAEGDFKTTGYAPAVDDPIHYLNHSSFIPWSGARNSMLSDSLREVLRTDADSFTGIRNHWGRHCRFDRLNNVLYTDVKTNLADYLITIEERSSMSHGLESRNPMLDHRVVNFLLSLPTTFKIREGKNKWIFHKLCERYLPREVFDRPKRGFTPPLNDWLTQRNDEIATLFHERQTALQDVFSMPWMAQLTTGGYRPQISMSVYYSLVLAMWQRHYECYIAEWPSPDAASSTTPSSPWHEVLREQDPVCIAQSRWFCQALRNFPAGAKLRLIGDHHDFHGFLARQEGFAILEEKEASEADGFVVIGLAHANELVECKTKTTTRILSFVPFDGIHQAEVQTLIERLGASFTIDGMQMLQLSPVSGVLVVILLPPVAVPESAAKVSA